jgi:hypothetical protein
MKSSHSKKLGPLVNIYGMPPISWRDFWLRLLPGILGILALLGFGLWRAWYGYTRYGPAAGASWGRFWFLLAATALVPLTWFWWYRIRQTRRMVKVYQNGIRILEAGGGSRAFLWHHLAGIAIRKTRERFLWIPLREYIQVTLHPHIGQPVRIDPRTPDLADLSARIKGKIYPRLLKEFRTLRLAGKNLYFGPITMTPVGLTLSDQTFNWNQIARMDVSNGKLTIQMKDGHRIKISVGEIPNVELLIQIIQEGVTP